MYLRAPLEDANAFRNTFVPPASLAAIPPGRLAVSPDGRRLAFVASGPNGGRQMLWIRALEGLAAQPLSGTEDASGPFWSPDSRFVAFTAGGKLKKIDPAGGPAITLCDASSGFPGAWNRDDVILFTPTASPVGSSPIFRVSAAGGTPSQVTTFDTKAGETFHAFPAFLPDGRHFLFTAGSAAPGNDIQGLYVGSLGSTERTRLLEFASNAQYAQGYLLYLRDATLVAQRFEPTRLTLSGEAAPLAEQVQTYARGTGVGAFTVSNTGVLVYQGAGTEEGALRLVWLDRAGKQTGVLGELATYGSLSPFNRSSEVNLSPDGRRAAVTILQSETATSDVWIFDVTRGLRTRFTSDPANEDTPVWSPDGSHLAFRSDRTGPTDAAKATTMRSRKEQLRGDLYQKASEGSSAEELLLADEHEKYVEAWSPDGRFLLYGVNYEGGSNGATGVWALPLFGDRKPFHFLESRFRELRSKFSPDSHWVAFQSNESGRYEVYVVSFPRPGAKYQVSTAGGREARWSHDGKEIFYLTGDKMMAAAVKSDATHFEIASVRPLFDIRIPPDPVGVYDVSRDGRFLITTPEQQSASDTLTLVVNWPALLRK